MDNWTRGLMAAVANHIDDTEGGLTLSGTNTLTLATNQSISAAHVAAGAKFCARVANTNTGAVTLNVDSTGAVAVVNPFGDALVAGELVAGMMAEFIYNSDSSQWVLTTGGFLRRASFSPSINDDAATSFTPSTNTGLLLVACRVPSSGLIAYTTTTPTCTSLAVGSSLDTTTGALTGTTGTDGKLTVSTHSTDGKIYIENRLGSSVSVNVITILQAG